MDQTEVCGKLGATDLFLGLDDSEIAALAAVGRVEQAYMDTPLISEGDLSDCLIIILDGEVQILKEDDEGGRHVLATLSQGAILGEVGILESLPRTATALAVKPVQYFALDRSAYDRLVVAREPAALKLTMVLARSLSQRLQDMNRRIVNLFASEPETDELRVGLGRVQESIQSEWVF